MSGGQDGAMFGPSPLPPETAADPYGDVALGVECAWPAASQAFAPIAAESGRSSECGQYTVSTGAPKT